MPQNNKANNTGLFNIFFDDKLLIDSVKRLNNKSTLLDKLQFIHEAGLTWTLFKPFNKVIEGVNYKFGIEIKDDLTARIIGEYFVTIEKEIILKKKKRDFLSVLDEFNEESFGQNSNFIEHRKRNYIEQIIRRIHKDVDAGREQDSAPVFKDFRYGYETEKAHDGWFFFNYIPPVFDNINEIESFNEVQFSKIADGAASYLFEVFLEVYTLEDLSEDSLVTNKIFDSANEALIFFKETGIYDALKNKYIENAKVAKVISFLTGYKWDYLERLLPKIDFKTKSKNQTDREYKKNNPYTIVALNSVRETFRTMKLESENLHDIISIIEKDKNN